MTVCSRRHAMDKAIVTVAAIVVRIAVESVVRDKSVREIHRGIGQPKR